ncbi:MAG: competence/damage-inducible protein A [Fimbriimonadaceae bacterium]|nr:competence/damage-inducible protein A [Fimbriimonadaceae bacterium]
MTAEIVSVGTELLLGQIIDTHAPAMAKILAECGVGCQRRATIGDNLDRLVAALRSSMDNADIVVTIGGLGPTMDDLTRDAIALALGDSLVRESAYEAELRKWFADRGYPFAESNAKQADRPESGRMIPNPNGTAPGLICQKNGKVVIALPGPKGEFQPMAEGPVREFLESLGGGVIHSRTLRFIGIGESMLEQRIADLMAGENPTVAPYAHTGEVHLRVTASARTKSEAEALIAPTVEDIRARVGEFLYAMDATTLEEQVIGLLRHLGKTVAVAESMTGGQLAARITSVPGASEAFIGGYVAYRGSAKTQQLGLDAAELAAHGTVSAWATEQLAQGALRLGADVALAITGNAGPATDGVGAVGETYVALAEPGQPVRVDAHALRGTREDIQRRATQLALSCLRDRLQAEVGG